ncbi:DUF6338 family protein, partial [Pseudomonas sp. B17(2017)]
VCVWVGEKGFSVGKWDAKAEACWAFSASLVLGLFACSLSANGKLHGWLRSRNVTKQSSYPSQWFSAFAKYDRVVTLHLDDERRVLGWPVDWPPESTSGQFVMQYPCWINEDGTEVPISAEFLLIDSTRVKWVEFSPVSEGSS